MLSLCHFFDFLSRGLWLFWMYLCSILFMWSVLCPCNDNKYKKFFYSFTAFFGEEHLDEILSTSIIQSSLMMCGGLYEVGLG
jgi:hypothetical protein